jgi:nucleoside-diphosphate-sugar epimerase
VKVLFIGGTGLISTACSQLCVDMGIDLHLLNRGKSSRPTPAGAKTILADIGDVEATRAALKGQSFDAVVNWIAFVPSQVQRDIELFGGSAGQYVFISSASAYQKPPSRVPITESTPLHNPFWEYSRNKIACEELLLDAYRKQGFPMTIVRPSHTYDDASLPLAHGYTVLKRMLDGKPVVVHGDGTSLWTLTHNSDFAKGFVPLLAHPAAIGHAFHITSDEALPWNQIYDILAGHAGVEAKKVHVPSGIIARHDSGWGDGLLGDKAHSSIFDNSKVKSLAPGFVCTVPYSRGAEAVVRYYLDDPTRGHFEPDKDAIEEELVKRFG